MTDSTRLTGAERQKLLKQLHRRYVEGGGRRRWIYLRKKYGWLAVVRGAKALKRVLDVVVSIVLLVLLVPLFLVISLLVKATDGGPVLYVTDRVGKWGRTFRFPKVRSMHVDADKMKEELLTENDHATSVTFKMKSDPRVTWIGRFIRRTSIDELPQLWCVLMGQMSLVGPRPPLPQEVAQYSLEERRRLDVMPGITCFWQVKGRGDIPFDGQVKLDLQYIESQSLWTDLWVLMKTIPAVLFGKGAY